MFLPTSSNRLPLICISPCTHSLVSCLVLTSPIYNLFDDRIAFFPPTHVPDRRDTLYI
ncbi:hypothetical protein C8R44DRAFT_785518 [Mycena epipterygia]|nr:hypothetical protein C8R44DRAFT_785518 [Mycena epipterygia]